MKDKSLLFLVILILTIICFKLYFNLIGIPWPYSSSDFNFDLIALILSLVLSITIALIGSKIPLLFRFLTLILLFPTIYFFSLNFFRDTLKGIDFGLSKELTIKKIVYSTDHNWVIHQLTTKEKGPIFISQLDTSMYGGDPYIFKGDTIKSIRIRESRTNPNHFYFYLKK